MSTLQDTLKTWAERQTPAEGRLDALRQRIHTRVAEERAHEWGHSASDIRDRLSYSALGAVAALAIVAAIYWPFSGPDAAPLDDSRAVRWAEISPEALQEGRELYAEVDRLFVDRLRWVAQSNGDVLLGVDAAQGRVGEPSSPAVVKLVVLARGFGQPDWRRVWQTDVILRSEEAVEVTTDQNAVDRVALWVYALADGRIAVDTDLVLSAPLKLASQHNAVVDPGVPMELVGIRQEGMEYRVLQTVAMLDGRCVL
jgi:hypothetical protein